MITKGKVMLDILEQILADRQREDAEFEAQLKENERRMLAAGFDKNDYEMFKAIFGWLPDISGTAGFLGIMCREFDHLQSAHLVKQLVPYMVQAAEYLHTRIDRAGLDTEIFAIQSVSHTRHVLGKLVDAADAVIAKHELAKNLAH